MALTSGMVYGIHELQMYLHAGTLKKAAEQAEANKDISEAAKLLRRYVNQKPQDMEARKKLASLFTQLHNFAPVPTLLADVLRDLERKIPKNTEEAEQIKAEIRKTQRSILDADIAVNDFSGAGYYIDKLVKETPNDDDLLDYQGRFNASKGENAEAEKSFRDAIAANPHNIMAYSHLIDFLLSPRMNRPKEAEEAMKSMLINNDKSQFKAMAVEITAFYDLKQGNYKPAMEKLEALLKVVPKDPFILSMAARCASHIDKRQEDALKLARRNIESAPKDPESYNLLAECYVRSGDVASGIKTIQEGASALKDTPAYGDLIWQLASLHLDTVNSAEAKKCIAELADLKGFPRPKVRFLEARQAFNEGRWIDAREIFRETRPLLNDNPQLLKFVDYWVGFCYGQAGEPVQQMNYYRAALLQDTNFKLARKGIADLDLANDDLLAALEEYDYITKSDADHDDWMSLARTEVLFNLRRPAHQQDWRPVEYALSKAAEKGLTTDIPMLKAEVLVQQGRYEDARKLLTELKKQAPKGVSIWTSLVALSMREDNWDEAKQLLDDCEKINGDKVALRLCRAQLYIRRNADSLADRLRILGENTEKYSSEEKSQLWRGLLSIALQVHEYDLAKQYCRMAAKEAPQDMKIRYTLFEIALRNRDTSNLPPLLKELDDLLDEIEQIGGTSSVWDYAKAVRLRLESISGNSEVLKQAMEYAKKANIKSPHWAQPIRLMGEILELQGKYDDALSYYQLAIEHGERDLELVRRTVNMLFERYQYAEADKILRQLDTSNSPLSEDLLRREVMISIDSGDFNKALGLARRAYKPSSTDYHDHVWQAQVLQLLAERARREGRVELFPKLMSEAEAALRKAIRLDQAAADVWVTLVQSLVAKGDYNAAAVAIRDAQISLPPRVAPLALAQCYEAVGDLAAATERYQTALKQNPDLVPVMRVVASFFLRNNKPELASPLLDRMLSKNVKVSEADLFWSRRSKAMLLANDGYVNLDKAVAMIDENLNAGIHFPEDVRAKAQLLMLYPAPEKHTEARQLIQSLATKNSLPEDRFLFSKLLLAEGNWDGFRASMQSLLSGQIDPRYASFYVNALLQRQAALKAALQANDPHHRSDVPTASGVEAGEWIAKLEKINPNVFGTVSCRAEFDFLNDNWLGAEEALLQFIDKVNAQPPDRNERILLVAQKIEQFAHRITDPELRHMADRFYDSAETEYKGYNNAQSGHEPLLAAFLAKRAKKGDERISEAIALIDKYAAYLTNTSTAKDKPAVMPSPADLAEPCAAVIRSDAVSAAQLVQLEKIIVKVVGASMPSPQQRASDSQTGDSKTIDPHNLDLRNVDLRNVDLLSALGELYVRQNRISEAEQIYRGIIKADPKRFAAYNNLGVLLASTNQRLDEALSILRKAIDIAGPRAELLDSQAQVLAARGENGPAIADLESAITQSRQAVFYYHKARVYLNAGQHDEAAAAMNEARKLGLERAMLDPTERDAFEKLRNTL
jgi:tetratricopeptide (TPR) repeat protein